MVDTEVEINISFGYQCNGKNTASYEMPRNSSFSCLSGAALSANATLANTNICNNLIGSEILPTLDSPTSFRRIPSSPSFSKFDILSSSLQSSMSNLSCSPTTPNGTPEYNSSFSLKSMSSPSNNEGFLNAMEVQVAGGAAGEDRVQTVCSEENGWVFCAIYDGFNGRDAADFLAGTLYETIRFYLNSLDFELDFIKGSSGLGPNSSPKYILEDGKIDSKGSPESYSDHFVYKSPFDSHKNRVLDTLQRALSQAESDFLHMVEQEMDERPDIVSVGSCVLVSLLHGKDLYILNLGDSRAVLASYGDGVDLSESKGLQAVQLTESHTVDNEKEKRQLLLEHPNDPATIVGGKVKGKLKVTRAFGVGYLKKKVLNDALMGILQVRNLQSPPYVSVQPSLHVHAISNSDHFVILASDGLFDFFTNDEAVKLVNSYILRNPCGDPAKFLLEHLVVRAADCAGFSKEQLMSVPAGRRRKYHDDVTVIVIILGANKRTSKASMWV